MSIGNIGKGPFATIVGEAVDNRFTVLTGQIGTTALAAEAFFNVTNEPGDIIDTRINYCMSIDLIKYTEGVQ